MYKRDFSMYQKRDIYLYLFSVRQIICCPLLTNGEVEVGFRAESLYNLMINLKGHL